MEPWPAGDSAQADPALLADHRVVQRVVFLGRAARAGSGHRVRQPLSRLLVRLPDQAAARAVNRHSEQILEELNVKALEFIAPDAQLVTYRLKPNLPRLGKRHGKLIPAIRAALAEADGAAIAAAVARGEAFTLSADGREIACDPEDVLVETASAEGFASAEDEGYLVALDTRLDEALLREGLARELVRTVQDARKQANFNIADRIVTRITGSKGIQKLLSDENIRNYVSEETLTVALNPSTPINPEITVENSLGDDHWQIELARQG
jgi:isoleucyl-tRNA synthetase